MPSVILVVFALQVLLALVSSVGAQTINDVAWWFFTRLPTQQSKAAEQNSALRNEVLRLQREMNAVSAQDDFAKWARLRRDHDKAKDKYEKEASASTSFRSTFNSIVSKLRWLATHGANFLINSWFAKQPMFWLPQGWVPYHAEWLLSFPRAPLGSVSVNVWAIACSSVVGIVTEGMVSLWKLQSGQVTRKETVKIPAGGVKGSVRGQKKEL